MQMKSLHVSFLIKSWSVFITDFQIQIPNINPVFGGFNNYSKKKTQLR